MAIDLSIFPTEAPAVIYLEDGSTIAVDCSTSGRPDPLRALSGPSPSTAGREEEEEHAQPKPPGWFAERMIAFWTGIAEKAREVTATPL